MTVSALDQPSRGESPSARRPWGEFLSESLLSTWRPTEWDPTTLSFCGVLGSPMTGISICLRDQCVTVVDGDGSLCSACRKIQSKLGKELLPPRNPNRQARGGRGDNARFFSLGGLAPLICQEILYGLQDRDRQQLAIRPLLVRRLVEQFPQDIDTIRDLRDSAFSGMQRSLFRSIQQAVRRLHLVYLGDDGTTGDIWDCAIIGLRSRPDQPYIAVTGHLDFTVIRQQWLRAICRDVLRARRPTVTECHRYLHAATIASSVLTGRPNGNDPRLLGASDMTAICQALATAISPRTMKDFSPSHRRSLLGCWRRLTDFARSAGLMDEVPGTFVLRPDHMMGPTEANEDEIGRVIPEEWINHLDCHLELLGTSSNYKPQGWESEDLRAMYRVYYQVVRDTGRRPSEIARLPDNPLAYTDGEPTLIYDNTKAGRYKRRLPIDESTATVIERWRSHLAKMHIPDGCEGYLFPAPGARNRERRGHTNASQFRRAFKAWIDFVPQPQGFSADAADFPAANIDLYGFRHSYAQRHADNGTPIDVLRDLMDHKEIDTTMGYYKVTLSRKQKAVQLVSKLALDRNGKAAPFSSEISYERASVATAYGNCTEPSNVKAGGKSCPIRFQCSGCGFYRPDPSYLSAIQHQLAQLRADRAIATAGDVAQWVVDNLDHQITSYEQIAGTMADQMKSMADPERHAIESACTDLRKARQAAFIPIDSLHRRPDGPR